MHSVPWLQGSGANLCCLHGRGSPSCCGGAGSRLTSPRSCSTQAQEFWLTDLVAPRHAESSRTRERTCVPCTGRRTPIHSSPPVRWATLGFQHYPKTEVASGRFTKQADIRHWLVCGAHRAVQVMHGPCQFWLEGQLNNVGCHACQG